MKRNVGVIILPVLHLRAEDHNEPLAQEVKVNRDHQAALKAKKETGIPALQLMVDITDVHRVPSLVVGVGVVHLILLLVVEVAIDHLALLRIVGEDVVPLVPLPEVDAVTIHRGLHLVEGDIIPHDTLAQDTDTTAVTRLQTTGVVPEHLWLVAG